MTGLRTPDRGLKWKSLKDCCEVVFMVARTGLLHAHKLENSSNLDFEYKDKKNSRNSLLHTIKDPLQRGFQNAPYFGKSNYITTMVGFPNINFKRGGREYYFITN